MTSAYRLEGKPHDEQKERLEGWLTELKIICRRYRLLLDTDDIDLRIIDMDSDTIIGIGVSALTSERGGRLRITGFDCSDSILDGVWPIDTPNGPAEQRHVQPVWVQRAGEDL